MAYFRKLPDLLYPSLKGEKNSSFDYAKIKNLFKRARIREDLLNVFTVFEQYVVVGDDRPDNVANTYYNDPGLDWLILIINDIHNVRSDWPMAQNDFNKYLNEKYTPSELYQIHHYETKEVRNDLGELVLPQGIVVNSNFTFSYVNGSTTETYSSLNLVTNFDYENRVNEEKRNVYLLRPEYVRLVEKDLRNLFKYDTSSEFIDQRTIKTYNPRIS